MSTIPADKVAAEAAWESLRGTIQQLYLAEDKTLKTVMEIVEKSYNFRAT